MAARGGGPIAAAGDVPPVASGSAPSLVAMTRSGGITGLLVAVAPDVKGVDLVVAGGAAWNCSLGGGLAMCTTTSGPVVTLEARDIAGRTAALRVP